MYQELFKLQESVFRTVANGKRLEIIQLLDNGGELTVSQITTMLGMRQANVSQHLAELRKAGLVKTRKNGVTIYYKLADARIGEACQLIRSFIEDTYPLNDELRDMLHHNAKVFPVAVDPVCHMRLSKPYAHHWCSYKNESYYFCAKGCFDAFATHPEKYITAKEG